MNGLFPRKSTKKLPYGASVVFGLSLLTGTGCSPQLVYLPPCNFHVADPPQFPSIEWSECRTGFHCLSIPEREELEDFEIKLYEQNQSFRNQMKACSGEEMEEEMGKMLKEPETKEVYNET